MCLCYYLRIGKAGLIFKCNLEKAFDFLLEVMTCALLGIGGYSGSLIASLMSDFIFTLMEAPKASLSLKEPKTRRRSLSLSIRDCHGTPKNNA